MYNIEAYVYKIWGHIKKYEIDQGRNSASLFGDWSPVGHSKELCNKVHSRGRRYAELQQISMDRALSVGSNCDLDSGKTHLL